VKPTRPWVLAVLVLLAGGVAYVLTAQFYSDVPSPPRYAPLSILLVALAEAYTAALTRARMSGRPGTRPIDPIFIAKLAALAKASSPVGALALGAYTGFLIDVAQTTSTVADADTRTAALGMGCSLGLVIAALVLERACRARRPPDDKR
jgi:Protein of unknown function (DUF3180)